MVGRHGDPAEPDTAALMTWLDVQLKRNTVLTFGGGANEVQRELIATVGLGLPRAPRGGAEGLLGGKASPQERGGRGGLGGKASPQERGGLGGSSPPGQHSELRSRDPGGRGAPGRGG